MAHPAFALQRKSALGARLQGHRAPTPRARLWLTTGQGKLPVLWLGGQSIADSTRIIAALEKHYPEPPLYPRDSATRQRGLMPEDDLDETLGPALRAAIVTPLFRHDQDIALRVLTTGMGGKAYGTYMNRRIMNKTDYDNAIGFGIQSIYGCGLRLDTLGFPRGFVVVQGAVNHEGVTLPVIS